ncbi:hypothetical protein BC833DRAFT_258325 [Globomyces pollinis-pini]|nr:hypothetical protein BC833DRAFT_258325 [Globomyces pollinis-pini]
MLFTGIGFSISLNTLLQYGVSFHFQNDKDRQKLLNLFCFVSIIALIPYYYTNQSKEFNWLNDTTLFIANFGVQFGLVVLIHNSLVKLDVYYDQQTIFTQFRKYAYILYFLPPFPLSLVVLSIVESQLKDSLARSSYYYTQLYKPYSAGAVFIVNIISITVDMMLIYKVVYLRKTLVGNQPSIKINQVNVNTKPKSTGITKPTANLTLQTFYKLISILVLIDLTCKVLVVMNYPVFDTAITITSLSLRSLTSLKFGMKLKNYHQDQSSTDDVRSSIFQSNFKSFLEPIPPSNTLKRPIPDGQKIQMDIPNDVIDLDPKN